MVGPALPDKATWKEFKAERNDFQPGECEHCLQDAEKLRWNEERRLYVCPSCWQWLEKHGE